MGVERPRHLFVDGYNILHAWGWLTPGSSGPNLQTARERLIEAVRVLHDVDGFAVTCVFDGLGSVATLEPASAGAGVCVIFAPSGRTADDLIETAVAGTAEPAACTVATADAMERETVSAAGAACLSPDELRAWCERSRVRASQSVARRADKQRQSWGNKLPL